MISRHFKAEKNRAEINGTSHLAQLTDEGRLQAAIMARDIGELRDVFSNIWYAPTPQCYESAQLLSQTTGLEMRGALQLEPYRMGVLDGLPGAVAEARHSELYQRLISFRLRMLSGDELRIPGAESMAELQDRLQKWWHLEGSRLTNSILVLSRSTCLMVDSILSQIPPTSTDYRSLSFPHGGFRIWNNRDGVWRTHGRASKEGSWPERNLRSIKVRGGQISATEFAPAYFTRRSSVVVVPGLFGNHRGGPYNLYNLIASDLAEQGYRVVTYDPIGAGDSTPIERSFDGDVESLLAILKSFRSDRVVLIGHSAGATVASAVKDLVKHREIILLIAVSPVTTAGEIVTRFKNKEDLATLDKPIAIYNGVRVRSDYFAAVGEAGKSTHGTFDHVVVGSADDYIDQKFLRKMDSSNIQILNDADHNFTTSKSKREFLLQLKAIMRTLSSEWEGH